MAGFGAIALSWRGAAELLALPLQTPFAISGGVAGLALIIFGVGAAYIHVGRSTAADDLQALEELNATLAHVSAGIVLSTERGVSERTAARRAQRRERRGQRSN